ncbi:MAG TPA: hypothetical protein VFY63_00625 [Pseudorhizobium sp.]|nr:hypothetical protein [Pseudorhizobium sp.]
MQTYRLLISDKHEAEISIEVPDAVEAMNTAFNALSQFACRNFPPPDNIEITVVTAESQPVGRVRMTFEVEWMEPRH